MPHHVVDEPIELDDYLSEVPDARIQYFLRVGTPFRESGKLGDRVQNAAYNLLCQDWILGLLVSFHPSPLDNSFWTAVLSGSSLGVRMSHTMSSSTPK